MKYLKMLGLAAIAALALAAFAGATTASAAVMCKTAPNKSTGVCEGGKYAKGNIFEATATAPVLTVTGSATTEKVTCSHSVVKLENTAESGTPGVPGKVTDITFTTCETNTNIKCTVNTTSGYTGELVPTNHAGHGTLTVFGNGTSSTTTTVNCGTFFTCAYKPPAAGLSLTFVGGNPFDVTASAVALARDLEVGSQFNCGTEAKWDATYTGIGTNKAAWVATS